MLHALKLAVIFFLSQAGVSLLSKLRSSTGVPRLLRWGATAGLVFLAVRK